LDIKNSEFWILNLPNVWEAKIKAGSPLLITYKEEEEEKTYPMRRTSSRIGDTEETVEKHTGL
jgi:hypothetical protein